MKRKTDLPADMLAEITDRPSAERFLTALHREGLDYHFDDGAVDCLFGNKLVGQECAEFIDDQVDACYDAWRASGADLQHDCPIGFMLTLMKADEAKAAAPGA